MAANGVVPGLTISGQTNSAAEEYEAQNMQDRKEAFMARARAGSTENYLNSTRTKPAGPLQAAGGLRPADQCLQRGLPTLADAAWSVLGYPSPAETAGSAVAGNISQLGADVTRRNLNIQPTIKVPVGYRFNVRVNRDMLFELPYRPVAG